MYVYLYILRQHHVFTQVDEYIAFFCVIKKCFSVRSINITLIPKVLLVIINSYTEVLINKSYYVN